MKSFYKAILLIIIFHSSNYAQELITYKDPTKKFEIGIPRGWTYSIPKNLAMAAINPSSTGVRENFNINIIKSGNADLKSSYDFFIKAISVAGDFKIIEQGEKTIHGTKYKWLIESHKNSVNGIEMINYIFLANEDKNILILTMVAGLDKFASSKDLFDKVALSLKY